MSSPVRPAQLHVQLESDVGDVGVESFGLRKLARYKKKEPVGGNEGRDASVKSTPE